MSYRAKTTSWDHIRILVSEKTDCVAQFLRWIALVSVDSQVYTVKYFPMLHMTKDISIKELRENLSSVADHVEKGESYRVIRRSKPSFYIVKIDAEAPEEGWETVVDFTDGGKTKGISIETVLKEMRKVQN